MKSWEHKRLGQSVAASRDGSVVIVPPEEIPVEDELRQKQPGKSERSVRDIEVINQNADRLNEEALDVPSYQADLWNSEVKDEE